MLSFVTGALHHFAGHEVKIDPDQRRETACGDFVTDQPADKTRQ